MAYPTRRAFTLVELPVVITIIVVAFFYVRSWRSSRAAPRSPDELAATALDDSSVPQRAAAAATWNPEPALFTATS